MAGRLFGAFAAFGAAAALGAQAVRPTAEASSSSALPAEPTAQLALVQEQVKTQIAEMALSELMAGLEAEVTNNFSESFRKMMGGFGQALLTSLKPSVEEVCTRVVEEVSKVGGMSGRGDSDDSFGDDFTFAQIRSDKLVSIAPHDGMGKAAFLQDQRFIDTLKEGLKSASSKLKDMAGPLIDKVKTQIFSTVKAFLAKKVGPVLRDKTTELIQNVCKKATEKMSGGD